MYEIKLKIGGVEKTFAKDFINIADNMLAVEHQVRQTAIVNNEKFFHDPKKHHTLNEEYLKMFVEMFGNQFCFRAVLFRMVPKPMKLMFTQNNSFRAVLFRMVPKLL